MENKFRLGLLSAVGVSLIVFQGTNAFRSLMELKANLGNDPLIYIEITPRKNVKMKAGQSMRFSVEGVYTSGTMPIEADWFVRKGNDSSGIPNCSGAPRCDVSAGDENGSMKVRAEFMADELVYDEVEVTVTGADGHNAAINRPVSAQSQVQPVSNTEAVKQLRRTLDSSVRKPATENAPLKREGIIRRFGRRMFR